ncbi:MAG: hypothetical protein M5U09_19980 [Gammaproteobacteria bacterium]|nr:hypothetical protein [Gammaproteobacteria bacterium]
MPPKSTSRAPHVQPTNFAQCAASAGCIEIDLTEPAAGDSGQFQILARPFPCTIAWKDVRVFDGVNVYAPEQRPGRTDPLQDPAQVQRLNLRRLRRRDRRHGRRTAPLGRLLGAHLENAPAGTRLLIPGEPEPTPASP